MSGKMKLQKVTFTLLAAAVLSSTASLAWADSSYESGDVASDPNALKYTGKVGTVSPSGKIDINYTNGIGAGGDKRLYLRICKTNGDCSPWDTRTLTKTDVTYNLAGTTASGTQFQIQYRAPDGNSVNPHWGGTVTWP